MEAGRPNWEQSQYKYQDNNNYKSIGKKMPVGHTYSREMLIIGRSSPQMWPEEITIWEQNAIRNWQLNGKGGMDMFSFLEPH